MTDETEQDRIERTTGLRVETVGEIVEAPPIEDESEESWTFDGQRFDSYDKVCAARLQWIRDRKDERLSPPSAFVLPVIADYPHEWPGEGIFFDMPEDVYHAVPAGSSGGIKLMAASPMMYWASCVWLNPDALEYKLEQEEKRQAASAEHHFDVGHAIHSRILEGREAFERCFAVELNRKDHPNAVKSSDEIQGAMPPGLTAKGKTNAEKFAHLQALVPDAEYWPDLVAAHAAANPGKTFISALTHHQLEIMAAMIERDDGLRPLVRGGYPEVSLFWHCPRTGIPKKARVDYLKIKAMVDLKSYANTKQSSPENAIRMAIAQNRYALQPSHYFEGAAEVRKLVRKHGASAVHVGDRLDGDEVTTWALKWASHVNPDEWFWLFVNKGNAPIARGVRYPRGGTTKMLFDDICAMMSRRIRQFSEEFGLLPWLDRADIYDLADEDLPRYATEI